MRIAVCGGAGYIGTHTCVELLTSGHELVVIDNFSNSSAEAIRRTETLCSSAIETVRMDIRDPRLADVFCDYRIGSVINFAVLKVPVDSIQDPIRYFDNNVTGTVSLLKAMRSAGVKSIIFSSSAAVYGEAPAFPVDEESPPQAKTPYGRSKLIAEQILRDVAVSDPTFKVGILRYFNPVGAHPTGVIGDETQEKASGLFPILGAVAIGQRPYLNVYGSDYPTRDGTGVRDYIHVMDLAKAHVRAVEALHTRGNFTLNVGTGSGATVLEVVRTFERVCGRRIGLRFLEKRAGDVAECYANPSLAKLLLGWNAEQSLEAMCRDAWNWQVMSTERHYDGGGPGS